MEKRRHSFDFDACFIVLVIVVISTPKNFTKYNMYCNLQSQHMDFECYPDRPGCGLQV